MKILVMTTEKLKKNKYTQPQFITLFRLRTICSAVRVKAAKELTETKVNHFLKNKKGGEYYKLELRDVWDRLNDLFTSLNIPKIEAEDMDLVAKCVFSGNSIIRTGQGFANLLLQRKEIKYFHQNIRIIKANVTEGKAMGLDEDVINDDDEFAF